MSYDSSEHHRRSIRVRGYDYSQRGVYFVTICAHGRDSLFGRVQEDAVRLNAAGETVQNTWNGLPIRFPMVVLDAFVVMPNHVHGVLAIVKNEVGVTGGAASSAPTLGKIVRAFKSLAAIEVNRLLDRSGAAVWQRGYYERIVRAEGELQKLQTYIFENPVRWVSDPENPGAQGPPVPLPW